MRITVGEAICIARLFLGLHGYLLTAFAPLVVLNEACFPDAMRSHSQLFGTFNAEDKTALEADISAPLRPLQIRSS